MAKLKQTRITYKTGTNEIIGSSDDPEIMKLVRRDQRLSWIYRFVRLIIWLLVAILGALASKQTLFKIVERLHSYIL